MCLLFACLFVACTPARREIDTNLVRSIRFEGNRGLDQSDLLLRGQMEQGDSAFGVSVWPLMYFVSPRPLRLDALSRDALRLEIWYAHHGWFDARFLGWEVRHLRPRRPGLAGVVSIRGHVAPGTRSMVRALDIRGLDAPELRPLRNTVLRTGEIQPGGAFDLDAVAQVRQRMSTLLSEHGFAYAHVVSSIDAFPEEEEVDVALDVVPGELATFGPVEVRGNEAVPERLIRDMLTFSRGETYDVSELAASQKGLFGLQVFSLVDLKPDLSRPDRTDVPVTIDVTEADFRTLRLGGGVELAKATVTPKIRTTFRHNNVFRRLMRLEAYAGVGLAVPVFRKQGLSSGVPTFDTGISLEAVRLFHRPWGVSASTKVEQDIQWGSYAYRDVEAKVRATWQPRRGVALSVGPELNWFRFLDLDDELLVLATAWLGEAFTNPFQETSIGANFTLDRRDDPLFTRRGYFVDLGIRQAIPLSASGFRFTDLGVDLRRYLRFGRGRGGFGSRFSAAVRLDARTIFPWGGALPYPDRVFLGGANSLRGYNIDQLGPYQLLCTSVDDGDSTEVNRLYLPKGGEFGGSLSSEVRVDLGGSLRGVVFADVGLLGSWGEPVDARALGFGTGVGLRYDTSIGPVRIDLAFRPLRESDRGPADVLGCTEDQVGAQPYDVFSALSPNRSFDDRRIPFAFNVYLAIGEAF